jgi:hypothetical protein
MIPLIYLLVFFFRSIRWVLKHLANDWLAGTWFFLFANFAMTIGSFGLLGLAVMSGEPKEIFIWLSRLDLFIFFSRLLEITL